MTSKEEPKLYVAVVIYESTSESCEYQPLFEESFLIIEAVSEDEASHKASKYAQEGKSSFKNEAGDTIEWSLKHVVDVNRVLYDSIEDGVEIYARHFRNYQAYADFEPLLSGEEL